ncbi:hypothetical protein B0O99DRAFT_650735 [Bisporella sp. PMI_857]|nr:hypothetical protein B0O99DRAFT_650735 [Bisporella sp. PMI_857]
MSEKQGLAGGISLPQRQVSQSSSVLSDDAVPGGDPNTTSALLGERLQAWKHAVGYLEEYITATEKSQRAHSKEYEKILKTIANPLREGHHFDQSLGGIAGLFENMRVNTQGLANSHLETEKNIKGSVLPILARLHTEIKNKAKELSSGAAKGAKEVDKARNTTQKHIELLGQQTANFESTGGKMNSYEDPYVVRRQVLHRLNKQILEENNSRHDLLAVQNNFSNFENHVIEVIQQSLMAFNQFVGGQAQKSQTLYGDMLGAAQRVPLDFEWANFTVRNAERLIDPSEPDRKIDDARFPNENHKSTKPLIEGTLSRKSRNKLSMAGYSTSYYVITPSKFLHGFKDNDNFRTDPTPELSIYLPDAVIGAVNGDKFNIKGKDVSKGIGSKLSGSSEIAFKGHTAADAEKWSEVIRLAAGATGPAAASSGPSSPISPVSEKKNTSGPPGYSEQVTGSTSSAKPGPIQTQGITGGQTVASPASAIPGSAVKDLAPEKSGV